MPQTAYAFLTVKGRQKEAAALATGTAVVVTHVVIGDAQTVPSGAETQLYHEVARKTVSGSGVVAGAENTAFIDAYLTAAEGPYTIWEAGLIDQDGDLVAIGHFDPPINKPVPASGQTVEGTLRIQIAFSNASVVTIRVDPSMQVALSRLTLMPWIPVRSGTVTAPPVDAAIGDVYVIPAGASGSWAAQTGKLAEYTAAGWATVTPRDGLGVGLPDGTILLRIAGAWQLLQATNAEAVAASSAIKLITPANLADRARLVGGEATRPIFESVRGVNAHPLSAGTDLDQVIDCGLYSGTGLVNAPDAGSWLIEVRDASDGSYIVQDAISSDRLRVMRRHGYPFAAWQAVDWRLYRDATIEGANTQASPLTVRPATETLSGISRFATAAEIAARSGTGVVQASSLQNVLAIPKRIVVYQTPGSYQYTVPAGCYRILVKAIGGGGAGGGSGSGAVDGGASGGGAAVSVEEIFNVTPGQVFPLVVGGRGLCPGGNANGGDGGTSSFGGLIASLGGGGGRILSAVGGASGITSGGSIGGYGGPGHRATPGSGGPGGSSDWGGGAVGGVEGASAGGDAAPWGAGGGGGYQNNIGGQGGTGAVIIYES
ncbi:phage tail protein [Aurantimonas sp. MSK8Z-1]|uniref:phage tail-collar fiber domain-containing protein n=1 Tax=Mangrovibrevibacter kandeliae TaxID=2968473 RepID=UPI002117EAB3|nr:phage tail protein [Aurantimonas sp. MSK8Z-1]MCW4114738.1 phage tail protein [Aurantimonas sp. MSK8Z-1]